MLYGKKRKYKCQKCGHEAYFYGKKKDKTCTRCGGKMKDVELRMKCPTCKNIIKRESGDKSWKCKACGHKEAV